MITAVAFLLLITQTGKNKFQLPKSIVNMILSFWLVKPISYLFLFLILDSDCGDYEPQVISSGVESLINLLQKYY